MRITGGEFRGRTLWVPKGYNVRPATDKVRQAVFNALLSRVDMDGAHVLDCFCGTGAYGLEALSRGAAHATFIDIDIKAARENIEKLGLEGRASILRQDVLKVNGDKIRGDRMKHPVPSADLLFLDPPYRQDLLLKSLIHIYNQELINDETVCVLECEKDFKLPCGQSKTYGDVQIIFLQGASINQIQQNAS